MTEGWLGDDSCPWGHPSPACRRELPSRGAILYPRRVYLAPEGSMWREVKKREEKRSTPAFFSFFTSRPPLWGSQGAGPLGRASRAIGSSGHLFRFLFGCPKRKDYRKYAMILEGLPQGGNPDAAKKLKRRIHRCRNSNLRRPSGQLPQSAAQRRFLPGRHAPAKRYGVVKYRLFQPGTGCGDHPLGLLK